MTNLIGESVSKLQRRDRFTDRIAIPQIGTGSGRANSIFESSLPHARSQMSNSKLHEKQILAGDLLIPAFALELAAAFGIPESDR
ncbi:hypothetical protein KKP04_04520 [Rhodomicrobium sp. Az07]|uniref:hypothetical protein n=1 Tax=Rhodomicrobium sp. Az07 TaxID=2839034 RepID=UPI001BE91180|nr:hypothetical protein [Rhodomicrobium sp. Az07]MBT3070132.1 hypothetical protein [Rhodomicrobium sp. Az07]